MIPHPEKKLLSLATLVAHVGINRIIIVAYHLHLYDLFKSKYTQGNLALSINSFQPPWRRSKCLYVSCITFKFKDLDLNGYCFCLHFQNASMMPINHLSVKNLQTDNEQNLLFVFVSVCKVNFQVIRLSMENWKKKQANNLGWKLLTSDCHENLFIHICYCSFDNVKALTAHNWQKFKVDFMKN